MSNPLCENGGMMNIEPKKKRVLLEPSLEELASCWSPAKRIEMARKMERWARQLFISAAILQADSAPRPQPRLRRLPPRKLRLN
jgi:hypothetical protein